MHRGRRGLLRLGGLALLGAVARPVLAALSRLAPATAPPAGGGGTGKRWAMLVNLTACGKRNGCTACIEACHRTHNVPSFGNRKDEIKWIWTIPYPEAFPEQKHDLLKQELRRLPTPVLCNHCDNPPCVRVCPVRATWKREDGLVMQDYHRCIGCRYCMVACPYGARSFNWRDPRRFIAGTNPDFPTRTQGVVEKCNFCEERLVQGRPPACVEACPEGALLFGDLEDGESGLRRILESHHSLRRKPELGTRPQVYYLM